ncbi:MAG: glycosyltransferase [Flavobacteriaceae bacterium]|nr:glycosyltransferase [Flavobacteriaceae bacterium]
MLSIVIPFYKLTFFEATLQSLSFQTDKRFKVYIGDDASSENPALILKKFQGLFDFEYKRFDNNLGSISLVKQWERCIALTNNGEWIMILGDDDVLSKNVVHEFYNNLNEINEFNINVVKFSTVVIDELGKPISKVFKNNKILKSTEALYDKLNHKSRSSLSEHFFRKSEYEKHKFKNYDIAWHSDDMAWLEFSNFKYIYCINSASISIRVSEKSISGSKTNTIRKNVASFHFYNDLINKHLSEFNWAQRKLVIQYYEFKTVIVKRKSLKIYIKLFWLYARDFHFITILRFTFRFIFKHKN